MPYAHRFSTLTPGQSLTELRSSPQGLSDQEATARLAQRGPNELPSHQTTVWAILLNQFRSPFLWVLAIAAGVALLTGELLDSAVIAAFVLINTALGFSQEYRSSRALKLLGQYIERRCLALRGGKTVTLSHRELVAGDAVLLEAGDLVPADLRLLTAQGLTVDESALTGESAPVAKQLTALDPGQAGNPWPSNLLFQGTVIASGRATGLVAATGQQTVYGQLAKLTAETVKESAFQQQTLRFSKFILRLVVATLAIVFTVNLLLKGPGQTVDFLLFSIALAVSVIPEALPLVTTISLAQGALRLAKREVVVKRLSAIEDLGSIEVLCADKTGTITENRLKLVDTFGSASVKTLPAMSLDHLLSLALCASPDARQTAGPNNAFDLALWERASAALRQQIAASPLLAEVPFDPERRRNSVLTECFNERQIIVRGALPEVLAACRGLNQGEQQAALDWAADQGRRGRRTIALATRPWTMDSYQAADEHGLTWLGALAFEDPLKDSAAEAIRLAEKLGVDIRILTGDSPEVAGAVGHQVGLISQPGEVITGEQLAQLKAAEFSRAVEQFQVFARVTPEQKYQIIHSLQAKRYVGFLGEGINDAPALKLANVSLAVDHAADVAREAADIILLRHNLHTIIEGVQEGRRIFANVLKYIRYTIASNLGNFFSMAVISLLIPFLPMLPIQVLLVNLLSDLPLVAVALDRVDRDELRRPRAYHFQEVALVAVFLGLVSSLFDFLFFAIFRNSGEATLQTMWFIESILSELAVIFSLRTMHPVWKARAPAPILVWLTAATVLLTIALTYLPATQQLFHFIGPSATGLLIVFGLIIAYLVCNEAVKLVAYRWVHGNGKKAQSAPTLPVLPS